MSQVKDPVCGLAIESRMAASRTPYQGETYYFCSRNCQDEFDSNPAKYARLASRMSLAGALRQSLARRMW